MNKLFLCHVEKGKVGTGMIVLRYHKKSCRFVSKVKTQLIVMYNLHMFDV